MTDGLSAADVALLSNRNNDGIGTGGGMLAMLAMFFLFSMFGYGGFGGFGGGWGGFGGANAAAWNGALTRGELCQDMNFQTMGNGIRGIQGDLWAQNTAMQQGFRGMDNGLCQLGYQTQQGFSGTNAAISEARFDGQRGFCDTQKEIVQNRYEAAQNTSAIIQAQERGTQRVIDWLCDRENRNLRDENMRNYISSQLCGVVRYPQSTTYSAGYSPCFSGYGNDCNRCNYNM